MKGKKITIIVISIIVILLLIAGVFAYLYFGTDMFKSDKELFYKYAFNKNMAEVINLNEYEEYSKRLNESSYTKTGSISLTIDDNSEIDLENPSDSEIMPEDFNIKYTSQKDVSNNRNYMEGTLSYLNTDLFTLKYLRDNDIYAITSEEVVNAYIGIENNNLKALVEKFGITDTTSIPDKIETSNLNYTDLLSISDEIKTHVYDKYYAILIEQIADTNYSKQKDLSITIDGTNIAVNEYKLTLTDRELGNLVVKILETLRDDTTTLNYIIDKVKMIDNTQAIDVAYLQEEIDKMAQELNDATYEDVKMLDISVYVSEGSTVRISFTIYNESTERKLVEDGSYKLVIDFINSKQKVIISTTQEDLETGTIDENTFSIIKSTVGTELTTFITFESYTDKEQNARATLQFVNGDMTQDTVNSKIAITLVYDEQEIRNNT